MSEFHIVETDYDDEDCIVQALEELGYKPEVCKEAKNLTGYHGDTRKQKAHIVIPRSQVSSASNDVGFEKVNGKYILHVSAYDKSTKSFNQEEMKKQYAAKKIVKHVQKTSKYKMKTQEKMEDGRIRIKLRRKF